MNKFESQHRLQSSFRLRPLKAAKVSEISEATASSPVKPDERVNFHIGNPIQDRRLSDMYSCIVLGLNIRDSGGEGQSNYFWDYNSNQRGDIPQLITRAIENSTAYMPRGGFNKKNPNQLAVLIREWLTRHQYEPLDYDPGTETGCREIIFSNGGLGEDLRIVFHSLSHYLLDLPAHIFLVGVKIPEHLRQYSSLIFHSLPDTDQSVLPALGSFFQQNSSQPVFLILGDIPCEEVRRELRRLCLKHPIMFIETNDAPNHLSLAREAGLLNRVIRIISPSAIDARFSALSISFMTGNSEFLKIFETVHFQLKGTPAAAEVELFTFLLDQKLNTKQDEPNSFADVIDIFPENSDANLMLPQNRQVNRIVRRLCAIVENHAAQATSHVRPVLNRSSDVYRTLESYLPEKARMFDPFTGLSPFEIIAKFFTHLNDSEWHANLEQAFLNAFLKHHPEYSQRDCFVVSGSARTALSLLGFHCGIDEVITPDMSWTYEHCFPRVIAISLNDDLSLDVDGIINAVRSKVEDDPGWRDHGAVVLNNPHNASGYVFGENDVKRLIKWLLEQRVFVIDDLAYQNVAPAHNLSGPKSVRQIISDMVVKGQIRRELAQYGITVHSLSKTDCFAGARMAVAEIPHAGLKNQFSELNRLIRPNLMATLLSYLFYRNSYEKIATFWTWRNRIFEKRMQALEIACANLPSDRNPYQIEIRRPQGAMYPNMIIRKLPTGISLDWLASKLALQGIGLIPLSTFARTAKGYEIGRNSFRLTLGGVDDAGILRQKTRRVLIDLNRLIAEESLNYTRRELTPAQFKTTGLFSEYAIVFDEFLKRTASEAGVLLSKKLKPVARHFNIPKMMRQFNADYLPQRFLVFRQKHRDRIQLAEMIINEVNGSQRTKLIHILEKELHKESLEERSVTFRKRLFDRTVHPTQMYALKVDLIIDKILENFIYGLDIPRETIHALANELTDEFLGMNVHINSIEEADELVLDLHSIIEAEEWAHWHNDVTLKSLISFWGDWDGSSRPSGQGHRLVAAVVVENVHLQAEFLKTLLRVDQSIKLDPELFNDLETLENRIVQFRKLLNEITYLTNQLEKRYQRVLPFDLHIGLLRRVGMKLHLARDPLTALWQHNDSLERKMLRLRVQRRENLEYYFSLNKRLRKTLFALLPKIERNLHHPDIALHAGFFRSLLRRFMLTPRIHQKMILAQDQFAIDTTVHNIVEINEIAGKYGTPGMVMGLQVSMSTDPEALIMLDRKMRSRWEEITREHPEAVIPAVSLIPLFEDGKTIRNLESYLDRIWEYTGQSQRLTQNSAERFEEMVCELFFAGSDLSQQVSQPAGAMLYREAKHRSIRWLAERGLVGKVRIKLGSGEPMQRQGGYYDENAGKSVLYSRDSLANLAGVLKDSARRSTEFAQSPLRGVLVGGDFRTFQSNVAEKLRHLSAYERARLLYHVGKAQKYYEGELSRADEPLQETRLRFQSRGWEELERLTMGRRDEIFNEFIELVSRYYQHILYGREEDVVGIHVISYFISRATPTLRDRPTVRPGQQTPGNQGQQIIERLAQTLPLLKHGSLFRAIGHNRAQTVILGVNQLTTGLFRALSEFAEKQFANSDGLMVISERILPLLPVHDILHTLRIYHDLSLPYIREMEPSFRAGNSAFLILKEDNHSIPGFILMMQKELLRRQGLNVSEFFSGDRIIPDVLPAFRPDVSILLQPDLFNTDFDNLRKDISVEIEPQWAETMRQLMRVPVEISTIRAEMWELIRQPIKQQVESFVELALAINSLSDRKGVPDIPFTIEPGEVHRLGSQIAGLLRGVMDDYMRQFLIDAVNYLTQIPHQMREVPIDVLRALRDVERILRIEEQVLGKKEQDLLRYYYLKIARMSGENG